jgi:hypothetical protein
VSCWTTLETICAMASVRVEDGAAALPDLDKFHGAMEP